MDYKEYMFVLYENGLHTGPRIAGAVKCKICGHECTQYHSTKSGALGEFLKRGHSDDMCKGFANNDD